MKPAVFLDRDGVINEIIYHKEMGIIDSPFTLDQFKVLPDVGKAINKLHNMGFLVIIVSNQPGIAKDHFSMDVFNQIREKMHQDLSEDDAVIDAEYYCLHHPYGKINEYTKVCDCRKPKPGMFYQAAREHHLDWTKAIFIGDDERDVQAGNAAGCKTILVTDKKKFLQIVKSCLKET